MTISWTDGLNNQINDVTQSFEINVNPIEAQQPDFIISEILWNPEKIVLFGLHCGWRGLLSGIVEKALSSNAGIEVTHAFIGPHISHKHFEVKNDFIDAYTSKRINIDRFITISDGKNYMNLRSFCEQKLTKYGIKIINESSPCSYEKSDSLFSWRRDKEKSLRNVCLSWF